MFGEPVETPYDIRFRLFTVDVRIHPLFWLMTTLLGWESIHEGVAFLVAWNLCVLLSILIHEFGHVFMGRLFGSDGHVVLYSFGGLAVGSVSIPSWWKRILVCLAGPLAGFLFWGVLFAALFFRPAMHLNPLAVAVLSDLLFINLWWGVLNLLPILPLDGGQISYNVMTRFHPDRGEYFAFGFSFLCAALLALNAAAGFRGQAFIPYAPDGMYGVLMFGYLAMNSFQALQRNNEPW
jgi:stage IV sporulation protein FB